MIHVALVEDDPLIRQSLALIIDGTPGFSCNHQYEDAESALTDLPAVRPDVILMDIQLPGISGIEATATLKAMGTEWDIVMLTGKSDQQSIFDSLCAGATGYLLKQTPPADLLRAIEEVSNGGAPMSASIARKVLGSFQRESTSPLTKRETEVLGRLCEGETYTAIAEALFVSGHTVRSHIKNIYQKLHVSSRAEAVRKALKNKLI
ncbi:MAG: response regulator transcription factor [Bacteroidota bacterium]